MVSEIDSVKPTHKANPTIKLVISGITKNEPNDVSVPMHVIVHGLCLLGNISLQCANVKRIDTCFVQVSSIWMNHAILRVFQSQLKLSPSSTVALLDFASLSVECAYGYQFSFVRFMTCLDMM